MLEMKEMLFSCYFTDFIKTLKTAFSSTATLNRLSFHKFADSYYVIHYIYHIATILVHSFHGQNMHEQVNIQKIFLCRQSAMATHEI